MTIYFFGKITMLRKSIVSAALMVMSSIVFAQQYTPADYMKALEFYYYESLTVDKLLEVGCKKQMTGLPVWFSVRAVQDEILSKSPNAARENVSRFFSSPSHKNAISDFFRSIDEKKTSKSKAEFDAMCSAMGSSHVAEWHVYRMRYFDVSMNIDPKYLR